MKRGNGSYRRAHISVRGATRDRLREKARELSKAGVRVHVSRLVSDLVERYLDELGAL
jgi:hypothetical protein